MSDLPSNPTDSTHLLQARREHREWIGGRALTLLSHYWRDDDPVELTAAIGRDWADVLEGIPQDYIQRACVKYQRQEARRKPTPGAIYQLAMDMMPSPSITRSDARPATREEDAAYIESVSRENINPERKAQAEAILAKFRGTA